MKVKMKLHSYAAAMEEKFKTEETCARLQWGQPPGEYRVFFCEGGQGDRNGGNGIKRLSYAFRKYRVVPFLVIKSWTNCELSRL